MTPGFVPRTAVRSRQDLSGHSTPPPRRVCVSLDMDAYPFERFPAERLRPCPLKTRFCLLHDVDCTLDPRPADGRQGPVLRDCRGCEQRGEGFQPRGGPAT
jgi:hypothetical protein